MPSCSPFFLASVIKEGEKGYSIKFSVYDYDVGSSNDLIAHAEVKIKDLLDFKIPTTVSLPLILDKPADDKSTLFISAQFLSYNGLPREKAPSPTSAHSLPFFFIAEVKNRFFQKLAERFDSDSNKSISFEEFDILLGELGTPMTDDQIEQLFNKFKSPKTTEMTYDELANCLDELTGTEKSQVLTIERNPLTYVAFLQDEGQKKALLCPCSPGTQETPALGQCPGGHSAARPLGPPQPRGH